jgi:esterase/lipase superfamily enzyme
MQYEQYLMQEVLPLLRQQNQCSELATLGCSFGGYHATNIALRHPDVFSAMLAMGAAFDTSSFLSGYYDDDCYFNIPTHYLANTTDPWYLDQYRRNKYVLATGVHDQCWNANERMAQIFRSKNIPVRLDVWGDNTGHDWPWWQKMLQTYL